MNVFLEKVKIRGHSEGKVFGAPSLATPLLWVGIGFEADYDMKWYRVYRFLFNNWSTTRFSQFWVTLRSERRVCLSRRSAPLSYRFRSMIVWTKVILRNAPRIIFSPPPPSPLLPPPLSSPPAIEAVAAAGNPSMHLSVPSALCFVNQSSLHMHALSIHVLH